MSLGALILGLIVPAMTLVGASIKLIASLNSLHHRIQELASQVDSVERQFKPNGGSSLKDDVNEMKGQLLVLDTRFQDHLRQHENAWR